MAIAIRVPSWKLLLVLLTALATAGYVGNSVCAGCHRNIARRYAATPMAAAATCERCHGPGSAHAQGSARMVVPSALEPAARDSVCAQCHLKGTAQVNRRRTSLNQFRPGEELTHFVATFVQQPAPEPASHFESLAASRCRRHSGTALWCATCHDVHDGSTDRQACSRCHSPLLPEASPTCGRDGDCVVCHMPVRPGAPVPTDHSIPATPRPPRPVLPPTALRPFTPADEGARELGLAYAQLAARTGDPKLAAQADVLLRSVRNPDKQIRTWLNRKTIKGK